MLEIRLGIAVSSQLRLDELQNGFFFLLEMRVQNTKFTYMPKIVMIAKVIVIIKIKLLRLSSKRLEMIRKAESIQAFMHNLIGVMRAAFVDTRKMRIQFPLKIPNDQI